MNGAVDRPLDITVDRSRPGTVVLVLTGDCDYETAGGLRDAAEEVLRLRPAPRSLTVDMGGVGLCDSSGLSAIVSVWQLTGKAGVSLRLIGIDDRLMNVMEITGLDGVLADALVPDPEAAGRSAN
ncbi:STAS domain-containing protein [Streptomyces sp. NPDC059506]|uniref:STAS domain-containing protein n=1 Tax=Streptomyces TaxID=1883 RepID=UPI0015FA4192|nr:MULTISPECIES: STAS domain-containing protein [unclassified Streptomyces]MCZ2524943.1 STAS domain-containing protein [Streptomyces sp. HB2AG]QMV20833.1 STAS domain-containing protein [Streptomyces sp. SCUT-3]